MPVAASDASNQLPWFKPTLILSNMCTGRSPMLSYVPRDILFGLGCIVCWPQVRASVIATHSSYQYLGSKPQDNREWVWSSIDGRRQGTKNMTNWTANQMNSNSHTIKSGVSNQSHRVNSRLDWIREMPISQLYMASKWQLHTVNSSPEYGYGWNLQQSQPVWLLYL